ncbi:MAG: RagB/SusD family nutrient uptake outer membrane protein, partial [Candidatus Competibacteraceae bacterium]|nr:RagB/SusD family nutrient uptake outer membrane protein [Candidatus Competibacteraceae bacterium]
MKNIRLNKALLVTTFLLTFFGCTTLEEEILDESLTGTGQAEVISGSIAPVYGLQEVASDEAILPYPGGTDWFDGGKFIAVHQHLTTPTNALVSDTWTSITLCLSRAVLAEERLKAEVEKGNQDAQQPLYEMIAMNLYL